MKIQDLLEYSLDIDKNSRLGQIIDKTSAKDAIEKIGNSFSNIFKSDSDTGSDVEVQSPKSVSKGRNKKTVDMSDMDAEFERQGIKDPYVKKALMGKFHQEAGAKLGTTEIPFRNTPNDRIRDKIPQLAHMSDAELNALKADDRAFFNKAYGGVIGNRDPDDGWKYRGRGLTGLTGKQNYADADAALGLKGELVKNPDLLLDPEIDKKAAVWYYKRAGADKLSFNNQEEANMWAIHKAGGRAYAPGTRLGKVALADLNKKTSNMPGSISVDTNIARGSDTGNVLGGGSDTGKVLAGGALLATASELINKYKTELPQFMASLKDEPSEEGISLIINGKKKKFKNKKEAEMAFKLAREQGLKVDYA